MSTKVLQHFKDKIQNLHNGLLATTDKKSFIEGARTVKNSKISPRTMKATLEVLNSIPESRQMIMF